MIATIHHSHRTTLFAEIHLTILTHHVEIAVNKQSALTKRTPERLLPIEVKVTMTIDSCAIQSIVSTFEMTVFIIRGLSTIQRIEVQTTDEANAFCYQAIPMYIAHVGLGNSITTFFSIKSWIFGIYKVYIAVVTHRQILNLQLIAPEVEHRKIANSTLRLSTLTSQHNILRAFAFSDEMEVFALNDHTKWLTTILAHLNGSIIRIVNPIDTRIDINRDAVAKMSGSILERLINKGRKTRSLRINHDVKRIEAFSKSQ